MNLKVKEFAETLGVSESIIYRHIRNNRDALGDRVIKKAKATWLTDEGQEYIRSLMAAQEPPVPITDSQTLQELIEEKEKNRNLTEKLIKAHETIEEVLRINAELAGVQAQLEAAESRAKLLETSRDDYKLQLEKKDQEVLDAVERAAKAESESSEARRQIDALKGRGLFARVFRRGE